MENLPRYRVPDELRETLLDFTIAYLLERPKNVADFGLIFFKRLKMEREGIAGYAMIQGAPGLEGSPADDLESRQLVLDDEAQDWILNFSIFYMIENPTDIAAFGVSYCEKAIKKAAVAIVN